jgi:DNA polymerase elongation subunit (family B)
MFILPVKQVIHRITAWQDFRRQVELSSTPLEDIAAFFQNKKKVKFYTDPYDQTTWPTAWELIEENEYCQFNIILGICYTIQLSDKFKDTEPIISISIDNTNKTVYYLLFIDDKVYGYSDDQWISANLIPTTLTTIKIYHIPGLH